MATDDVLAPGSVRIHPGGATRDEAMREATDLLVAAGVARPAYYEAMRERERSISTFMGSGLAIPHGTLEAMNTDVLGTGLTFVRYDGGVDWDGHPVTFVVGIAGRGGEHLELLGRIADLFSDADSVERLAAAPDAAALFALVTVPNAG
jgi:PTS system mannitol-specific IIA component